MVRRKGFPIEAKEENDYSTRLFKHDNSTGGFVSAPC
jgi:hypothetical protein